MARGNPGRILRLADGRFCILYNRQPLEGKGKIILHLIDADFRPILDENRRQKTLLKNKATYNEEMAGAKGIGMVD